jgi:hypothetical protein
VFCQTVIHDHDHSHVQTRASVLRLKFVA